MRTHSAAAAVAAFFLSGSITAAPAQEPAQELVSPREEFISTCTARWIRADLNGDGYLDKDEIEKAGRLIPSTIISPASMSSRQFVDACVRLLQDQQAQR